ncbi:sensor domain-containing diguanylate cyclase [Neiella marina]|uniref:Sensor domain-containing diguanylate cyclase n=1 Tax=Neiella holothuriorum TaxID=2870530 RepID=A0ABS7EDG8_9GAMM|nr:sensor domain-containing diguanylate cyclase [Neiella holothuriorum]MBW8189968.1 sensor domain-containing diguanylate cyclase [Neiella holothuriorum]
MKKPSRPNNEAARLVELRSLNILDTSNEERFDRVTRIAQRVFDVPIAVVSLVDDERQWFKSCAGLDATETSRDVSFCGHAILDSKVLLVTDALEDERFCDNPLVTGAPYIRFYAGCPLRSPNGLRVGTLCLIDSKPRDFCRVEMETLVDLASMVERELAAFQLATMDELTGISNRRGFTVLAEHSLSLFAREHIPATLVFFDLDHFKEINDTFGHAEGDRALEIFARVMRENFRESDLFARIGGDEFVVLFTNTRRQIAMGVLKKFAHALKLHNINSGDGYEIEFSCGAVQYDPLKHDTVDALLADGDQLMYHNKQSIVHLSI